jgi:hypothetical protein
MSFVADLKFASFVLLAGAGMLLTTLVALQRADRLRDAAGTRGERAADVLRPAAGADGRVLRGRHAAD